MNSEKGRWFGVGIPLLVLMGLGIDFVLKVGVGLPWHSLLFPILFFSVLQVGTFIGMFWARTRAKERGKYGPAIILMSFYCWAAGCLVIHYGAEWDLLPPHKNDFLAFSLLLLIATAITWILFSRANSRRGSLEK